MEESIFESWLKKSMSRKEFVKLCALGIGSLAIEGIFSKFVSADEGFSTGRPAKNIKGNYDLVVAKGEDPYIMAIKAMESMGGMERFVKKNSTVLIKPNIAWDRIPEQAATTNPQVIAALVEMCFKVGARRVNVFDRPCNEEKRCYANSGIEKAAKEKGANVYFLDDWNIVKARFNYESPMQGWPIYRDALECDTFINVPILKHHGLAELTLSMKNLMGICGGNRALIHFNMGVKLAHITDFIKPELTIIDAYRVLKRNGPSGGNLEDVVTMKTLIIGTDPVLTDSYACKLVEREPLSISYINEAVKHNFGSPDIAKANILSINT